MALIKSSEDSGSGALGILVFVLSSKFLGDAECHQASSFVYDTVDCRKKKSTFAMFWKIKACLLQRARVRSVFLPLGN